MDVFNDAKAIVLKNFFGGDFPFDYFAEQAVHHTVRLIWSSEILEKMMCLIVGVKNTQVNSQTIDRDRA